MSNVIPDEVLEAWPNCSTADCHRKACASANSIYCSPCTKAMHAENSAPPGYFRAFEDAKAKFFD